MVQHQRSGRDDDQPGRSPGRHGGTKTPYSIRRQRIRAQNTRADPYRPLKSCLGRPTQADRMYDQFYSIQNNNVTVDNVTTRDGGNQKITINGTEVKLDFVDEKNIIIQHQETYGKQAELPKDKLAVSEAT